jgi:hypothetical protein
VNLFAALLVTLQLAAAQPPTDTTTDVDENTTAAEASPLAPRKALETAPPEDSGMPGRSLDDILSSVRPVETAEEPKAPEEAPRAGLILATPAGSPTSVAPTYINDRNSRPDGPPSESDNLYETRILGAFKAAQIRQGPLDGRWLVAKPGGDAIYALQFADPGSGDERIEGAWRNVKVQGLGGSGFIEAISRDASDVVVRFQDTSTNRNEEIRLRPTSDGAWKGELIGGGKTSVVMRRDASVELAAMDAPIYIPPPPPPPRPAVNCKRVKSHGKWKTVCARASSSKAKGGKAQAVKSKGSKAERSSKKGGKAKASSKSKSHATAPSKKASSSKKKH